MAKTIVVDSCSISNNGSPPRNHVGETTIIVHYEASASWHGDDITSDPGVPAGAGGTSYTSHWNEYEPAGNFEYYWTIVDSEYRGRTGDTSPSARTLEKGAYNSVTGSVYAKGKYTPKSQNYSRDWVEGYYSNPGHGSPGDDDYEAPSGWVDGYYTSWRKSGGVQSAEAMEVTSATKNCEPFDAWTRPGTFLADGNGRLMTANVTIQSGAGLTSGWTEDWAKHMNKIGRWFNQSDGDVADGATRGSGELVSADWYNTCSQLINTYTDGEGSAGSVSGGPEGTVISAAIINVLAENNKRTGEV